jgi:hypothetical protein
MKVEWNWPIIITAAVAVYGAILSTVNTRANLRAKEEHLSVIFKTGTVHHDSPHNYYIEYSPTPGSIMLFIEIINVGNKIVTIKSIDIESNKKFYQVFNIVDPVGASLPYTLEGGKSFSAGIDMQKLARLLIQNRYSGRVDLQAHIISATSKVFKAKRVWVLDLDKYSK